MVQTSQLKQMEVQLWLTLSQQPRCNTKCATFLGGWMMRLHSGMKSIILGMNCAKNLIWTRNNTKSQLLNTQGFLMTPNSSGLGWVSCCQTNMVVAENIFYMLNVIWSLHPIHNAKQLINL
jgi:hypothetical protein